MARSTRDRRTDESSRRPGRSASRGRRRPTSADAEGTAARRSVGSRSFGRALGRMMVPLVLAVLTVLAIGFFAMPARTLLEQRRTAATSERRLAELDAANAEAEALAAALQSDQEIERMAREQYGYARAGEEVYHLLPEARDPVRVPDAWPFAGLGTTIER